MSDTEEKYATLLQQAKQYFKQPKEKNVFSIGGRGHYENPISDILAFFLNPDEEHKLGSLFLKSLFECIGESQIALNHLKSAPSRERMTDQGKRIDILIEGETWVMVIENKIFHIPNNPFKDYEEYVNKHYREQHRYFVLLSPTRDTVTTETNEKWHSVSYFDFIKKLKEHLGSFFFQADNNKWIVIFREFILNLEGYIGDEKMDKNLRTFVQDKYADIYKLLNLRDEYVNSIFTEGLRIIAADNAYTRNQDWGEHGRALRFYGGTRWPSEANITILLCNEGKFTLKYYLEDNKLGLPEAEKLFNEAGLQKDYAETEQAGLQVITKDGFATLDDVFEKFDKAVKLFNEYYGKRSSS